MNNIGTHNEAEIWALIAIIMVATSLGSLVIRQIYIQITHLLQRFSELNKITLLQKPKFLSNFNPNDYIERAQKNLLMNKRLKKLSDNKEKYQELKENYHLVDAFVLCLCLFITILTVLSPIFGWSQSETTILLKVTLCIVCVQKIWYIIKALYYCVPSILDYNFHNHQRNIAKNP